MQKDLPDEEQALQNRLVRLVALLAEAGRPVKRLEEFTNKSLQLPLSWKQWSRLKGAVAEAFLNVGQSADQNLLVGCLELVDSGGLLQEIAMSELLKKPESASVDCSVLNFVLSVIL